MRQKSSNRKLLVVAALVVTALILVVGAAAGGGDGDKGSDLPKAVIMPVIAKSVAPSTSFEVERSYTGELRAGRRSPLAFERLGLLVEVRVDDGGKVAAGQLLARLDDRHLKLARDRIAASLAAAKALLEELVAGPRAQTIEAARAELADLDAQLAWAGAREQRRSKLIAKNALSKEEGEGVTFEADSLRARRRAAAARLSELEEGSRKERIAAQRAAVAEFEARLAEIDLDIEKSKLVAPYDGRVAARQVDEGRVVNPGQTVIEIVESDALEARIGLPPGLEKTWRSGDEVELEIEGRIVRASFRDFEALLDRQTRSRIAIFDLADDTLLLPGQIVRVKQTRRVREPGLWLPRSALVKGIRGLWSCFVVVEKEGQELIERRALEVLHDTDDRVYVRGTIAEGERVVLDGSHRIVEGQLVEVKEEGR